MLQRLGAGARRGGGLRGRQVGPLARRLGGGPGLGEGPCQRGWRGEGRGGGHLGHLPRGADGGVALGVAEAVGGRGAGGGGRQADGGRLTRGLVRHGPCLAVGAFGWDGGQLLSCRDTGMDIRCHDTVSIL